MSDTIDIIGAETHNLKNISVSIPKNTLVVVTGVSGSGKSSLAFDTLYAEGQKRYLESLSTYARMIISDISEATQVREIRGLSPTIAIHQKTVSNNPRSTVGTITEIYDFYRLLYTTIGVAYCPNHPHIPLKKDTIQAVIEDVELYPEGTRFHVLFPLQKYAVGTPLVDIAKGVTDLGFVRFQINKDTYSVAEVPDIALKSGEDVSIIVDRLIVKKDADFFTRLRDSLNIAQEKSEGRIAIYRQDIDTYARYSMQAACPECGYTIGNIILSSFSFNSPQGACESCHGLGYSTTFREEDIMNPLLTLAEGAILPWQNHPYYTFLIEAVAKKEKIPLDIEYGDLTPEQKEKILYGVPGTFEISYTSKGSENKIHRAKYEGLIPNLERRYHDVGDAATSDAYLKRIASFATEQECRVCHGYRLRDTSLNIRVSGKNIGELASLSVEDSLRFFQDLILSPEEQHIARPILKNIVERLEFLQGVGLSYVTLARRANSLSGGESQRIRLATQIGTRLEGIIYVLDEPSIGLHPRDNDMLTANLKRLAEIGNTVVVVEHDEDIMRESDYIVDIGPGAGVHGGEVLFSGTYPELLDFGKTETAEYLTGKKQVIRKHPVKVSTKHCIEIYGARENNLKNINVRIPLGCMTVVTGVSGSGKSSLIIDILSNKLLNYFNKSSLAVGRHDRVEGLSNIDKVIIIDQSPIGKTPHSNIATYTGVFTFIREVFAASLDAQKRGFGPGRFSFNTKGGRCEVCEGSGTKKIEMHFLPDVYVQCEVCGGTRYNQETLEIQFKGKNIADILAMTIEEALGFFAAFPRIVRILQVLQDVGLGYITLGQSAPTLSGGESQRIKLAFDLAKRSTGKTLYILDEPTTGLHFSDVQKLLDILDKLVEKGNSVLVIEHNLDIINAADAIIDIGLEGGDAGGNLVFAGPREKLLDVEESYTAKALRQYLEHKKK